MMELLAFVAGLIGGGLAGSRLYRHLAVYWETRARELERRERDFLTTILELRRAGYEPVPHDEGWKSFVITDDYSARVAEEREGRGAAHDEFVRMVAPD
mgnify:CR=1 FL=1